MKYFIAIFILISLSFNPVKSWDDDDYLIFDLVEEINQNFYTFMGIKQDATLTEIKKAFRGLSIQLHPDKNPAEDANIQFRNLVSIYETLRETSKREKYDKVLKDGLPNWKSAAFYFRKVRKVGLLEGLLLVFAITTVAQYLIGWAIYIEKKYTMEQLFETKAKKVKKANINVDSIMNEIPKPSIKNTLPFQIPLGIYHLIIGTPSAIKGSVNLVAEEVKRELERKRKEKEEEEMMKKLEEERQQQKLERKEGLRKRKEQQAKLLEKTDEELKAYSATIIKHTKDNGEIKTKIPISGGLWTDDDLSELTRLTKKYPGGTVDRWETIAACMNRNVSEVTFMAYKLKDNVYQKPGETEKLVENINRELSKKTKTKSNLNDAQINSASNWTQDQQKMLEIAIQKNPKRGNEDRWAKIAGGVPGKTKEDCIARYKFCVDLAKKQKEEKEQEERAKLAENQENQEPEIEDEVDEDDEPAKIQQQQSGGKKRNKRKDRKKNVDFYADDSDEIADDDSD